MFISFTRNQERAIRETADRLPGNRNGNISEIVRRAVTQYLDLPEETVLMGNPANLRRAGKLPPVEGSSSEETSEAPVDEETEAEAVA